jgi:hypothetical protein
MSCPAGRPSISAFTAKSLSGSASSDTERIMVLKLSLVAMSKVRRAGRSTRAQTTPESIEASPDCRPWVRRGRSAARLSEGRAMPSARLRTLVAAAVARKRRRFIGAMRIVMFGSWFELNQDVPRHADSLPTIA